MAETIVILLLVTAIIGLCFIIYRQDQKIDLLEKTVDLLSKGEEIQDEKLELCWEAVQGLVAEQVQRQIDNE